MTTLAHTKQLDRAMQGLANIKESRTQILDTIAKQILLQNRKLGKVQLVFICTHNARRSQIAEALLKMSLAHFNIKSIEVNSAGTEKTSIPSQIMDLFIEEGYECTSENGNLTIVDHEIVLHLYSKTTDELTELQDAIAIMVCDDANEKCPFIAGAPTKYALTYTDPKSQDGAPSESKAYKACFRKILTEMAYLALVLDEQIGKSA